MTFLPADSEGGQNIDLWIFFSGFFWDCLLAFVWHLELVVAGICLDFFG